METIHSYEGWVGTDACDVHGVKIETIDAIYDDEQTGRLEWLAIRTGFFGMRVSYAPIVGGVVRDGHLALSYSKDQVIDAPNIDLEEAMLTGAEEQRLFRHYGTQLGRLGLRGRCAIRQRVRRGRCPQGRPVCVGTSSPRART